MVGAAAADRILPSAAPVESSSGSGGSTMGGSVKGSAVSAAVASTIANGSKPAGPLKQPVVPILRTGSTAAGITQALPGMARLAGGMSRAASTEDLGTAADVATFRPPVGVARMDRAAKRAAATPGLRRWFRFDKSGRTSMVHADKHAIAQKTGVQVRDLRLVDPQLATSYPSAILARESALVLNLEFIKALVTTDYVLILNAEDETVIGFVEELQKRLGRSTLPGRPNAASASSPELSGMDHMSRQAVDVTYDDTNPPFELRVLEVALDVVCNHLERLSVDLEAAAHPALDALTKKVTPHNLERVRRIKSRMVRLNTRGETIREVLEKFLDDDDDMKDMNLSAKAEEALQRRMSLQRRSVESTAFHRHFHQAEAEDHSWRGDHPGDNRPSGDNAPSDDAAKHQLHRLATVVTAEPVAHQLPTFLPSAAPGRNDALREYAQHEREEESVDTTAGSPPRHSAMRSLSPRSALRGGGRRTSFSAPSPRSATAAHYDDDSSSDGDVNEVEMLLEAYFMQVDNTCNKLQTLHEYIDDTEDYLNIELDSHRNQLIQLELVLTAAMFALALVTVIAGIFGMNMNNTHEDSYSAFVTVCVVSCSAAALVFIAIVLYCRRAKLLC